MFKKNIWEEKQRDYESYEKTKRGKGSLGNGQANVIYKLFIICIIFKVDIFLVFFSCFFNFVCVCVYDSF